MTDILSLLNNLYLALLVFALAQIADVITTIRALQRGGREINPLIAWLMQRLGKYGWVGVKLAGSAGGAALCLQTFPVWVLWPLAALLALVAWHNARIMR